MNQYVFGQSLADDLNNLTITRKPIIEEFLYERDILMIPAQAGAGKSIIATQIAISLSSGVPLFGILNIPTPKRVLYLQLEGDYEESIERMRHMRTRIPVNTDNLCWFECKMLDTMNQLTMDHFFKVIKSSGFIPEVVIVDPLYKLCPHDLATGEAAITVVKFSDRLYEEYNCTNVLIHHNHREKYTTTGHKMKEDNSYYGHSFIQNHIRTSYELTNNAHRSEPLLSRKKGRGSDTAKTIRLSYDPVSMTCWMEKTNTAIDRIKAYATLCKHQNIRPTFEQFCEGVDVSHSHGRRIICLDEFSESFNIDKSIHNKHFYIPK